MLQNGVSKPMGRYPNNGYFTYEGHSGKNSITDNQSPGITNWTGAELVIRSSHWTLDRTIVSTNTSGLFTYNPATTYEPVNGLGYFIQNDSRTLDTAGEWYYNPTTHRLKLYSREPPLNVQMSTKDTLISIEGSNIIIDNIEVSGANMYGFSTDWYRNNVTIQNCAILFSGIDAIKLGGLTNVKIQNNIISNSNNNGINLYYANPYPTIKNNIIRNTGIYPGMGQSGTGAYCGVILNASTGSVAEFNKIVNTGYDGLFFSGDSALIANNYIDTFCITLEDGGGIYTSSTSTVYTGSKVKNNIILNGIGVIDGSTTTREYLAEGIYLDDGSEQIEVSGNTVGHCGNQGIFLHNANEINVHHNTVFNCFKQLSFQQDQEFNLIQNNNINNNIFVSKLASQPVFAYTNYISFPINKLGISDYNYYARPIDDNLSFLTNTAYNLSGWQSYSGLDANSKKSPRSIK
ncbi:MAG: right-handed parallel beta-helix repeat-containing protein, partial [Pedobacter sp.]